MDEPSIAQLRAAVEDRLALLRPLDGEFPREDHHRRNCGARPLAPGSVALVFTCTALPSWPGDDEAVIVDGPWAPCVDPEPGGRALG